MRFKSTKTSFTLIEVLVTISIVIIIAAINFGVFYVYQSRSVVDRGINDLRDTILRTQNLAFSPSDPNANNYILFLNTDPTQTHTPFFQAYATTPGIDECQHLPANGGWCIMREVNGVGLVPYIAGPVPCPWPETACLAPGIERHGVARGKLDLGNATISASPYSGIHTPNAGECPNGDCGYFDDGTPYPPGGGGIAEWCNYYHVSCAGDFCQPAGFCFHGNEDRIIKISFRTWDGKIGINGSYSDVNPGYNPGEEAHYTITSGEQTKTLYINLYTSAIRIE